MKTEDKERIRLGCIRVFLQFMFFMNLIAAFMNLSLLWNHDKTVDTPHILMGAGLNFLNAVFAYFLMKQKKVGFYGISMNAVTAIVLNHSLGLPLEYAVLSVLNPILLYFLIRPYWDSLN